MKKFSYLAPLREGGGAERRGENAQIRFLTTVRILPPPLRGTSLPEGGK